MEIRIHWRIKQQVSEMNNTDLFRPIQYQGGKLPIQIKIPISIKIMIIYITNICVYYAQGCQQVAIIHLVSMNNLIYQKKKKYKLKQ